MAKYHKLGYNTYGIVVTVPEYQRLGDSTSKYSPSAREEEGIVAADILGYELISLRYRTRRIEYDTELVQNIEGHLEDILPDIIITQWVHDVHQDHEVVGKCVLRASRHLPRLLMFRSNKYKSMYQFNGNFYVGLTQDMIDKKHMALQAHQSEYTRNGESWWEYFLGQNRAAGLEVGVEYAEEFEVVKWLEY